MVLLLMLGAAIVAFILFPPVWGLARILAYIWTKSLDIVDNFVDKLTKED